jgi:hypothetical protein
VDVWTRCAKGVHAGRTLRPYLRPADGANTKMDIANPLSLAAKQSAITPPAFVRGEEPNDPAKNRKMSSVVMLLAAIHPEQKAVNPAKLMVKMICLP